MTRRILLRPHVSAVENAGGVKNGGPLRSLRLSVMEMRRLASGALQIPLWILHQVGHQTLRVARSWSRSDRSSHDGDVTSLQRKASEDRDAQVESASADPEQTVPSRRTGGSVGSRTRLSPLAQEQLALYAVFVAGAMLVAAMLGAPLPLGLIIVSLAAALVLAR